MKHEPVRRQRLKLSGTDMMQLYTRSPLLVMWWAASFTGVGQMMAGNHIKGYLLAVLEILINVQANINIAIVYSFTGQFALATATLDTRWLLAYVAVYLYGIWDAYHSSIGINTLSVLAAREKALLPVITMTAFNFNSLDKRVPWLSIFWSLTLPGLGHVYCHRLTTGILVIGFTLVCFYLSGLLDAIHYTFLGSFSQATAACNPEWLLFLPSVYSSAVRGAYVSVVEVNKLFDSEQREFLRRSYQTAVPALPVIKAKESEALLIAAVFDHSPFVELAVTELEDKGIEREQILAIPLIEKADPDFAVLDTIHRADGVSMIDLAAIFANIGMVLGVIYGFVLLWGPIIWGLLGLLAGVAAGLALGWLLIRRKRQSRKKSKVSELLILVSCEPEQVVWVEQVLHNNTALGVGTVGK